MGTQESLFVLEASRCCHFSSLFIRHQRTPTEVYPWNSDFILSVSHGLLVCTGGFDMVRIETGKLG